jgi:hypothetical protein
MMKGRLSALDPVFGTSKKRILVTPLTIAVPFTVTMPLTIASSLIVASSLTVTTLVNLVTRVSFVILLIPFSFLILLFSPKSYSDLGQFDFDSFRIQGGLGSRGFSQSQISTLGSFLGLRWQLNPHFTSYFELGDLEYQRELLWIRKGSDPLASFGFRSLYMEYQSSSLGFRFGLLPNAFDSFFGQNFKLLSLWGSSVSSSDLASVSSSASFVPQGRIFLPHQAYEHHLWRKQNVGFEFFWSYESWLSRFQVYRSEESSGLRGSSPWVSGLFSYQPRGAVGLRLQAFTGHLEKGQISSSLGHHLLGGSGYPALEENSVRVRGLQGAFFKEDSLLSYSFQGGQSDMVGQKEWVQSSWFIGELSPRLTETIVLEFRGDYWLPNKKVSSDALIRKDFGFSWKKKTEPFSWQFFIRQGDFSQDKISSYESLGFSSEQKGLGSSSRFYYEAWLYFVLSSY